MEENKVALLAFLATLTFVIFLGYIIFRIWDVIEQRRSPATAIGSGSFKAEISASPTTDPIYDQIYATEKQSGTTKAIASDLVSEFLDTVLFASDLHSSPDASWAAFFTSLLQHHRYTAVFFVPANKFNRTLRWTSLTMGFLVNLFIVTVYFGTFFPDTDDNENCDVYTTKESCLNDEYGVGNTNQCSWNAATLTCGDKRPSRTFVYLILVVLLVVVISIPFQVAYDYLLVNVCMRRPRFEDWGIAAASWMGRNAATEENDQTMLASSSARTLLAVPHFRPEAAHDGSSLSVEEEVEQVKTRVGGPGQTVDATALLVAREGANSLVLKLNNQGAGDTKSKEILLLQHFILEQFSTFKQFVLRRHMFDFTPNSQTPAPPLYWLLSWFWVILSGAFFLAWAFAWASTHRGAMASRWGIVLGVALAQDLFVIQPFRAYIIHSLSMKSIRPQLQDIYRVLHSVAVAHTQDEEGNKLGDNRLCQHVSPACRAAHADGANSLAAATILRRMDDADVAVCREKHSTSFPVLASVTLALPVVFGWAGDVLGLVVLGALLPAFFDALLIMNRYFYSGAGIFIILPYLFVLLVWVFWHFIIQPAFEEVRLQREAEARKATLSSNTHVTAV